MFSRRIGDDCGGGVVVGSVWGVKNYSCAFGEHLKRQDVGKLQNISPLKFWDSQNNNIYKLLPTFSRWEARNIGLIKILKR